MISTIDVTQTQHDFKDWEKAFFDYYRMKRIYGDDIQFVVDNHPYSSGYWVEKTGTEVGGYGRVYTHAKVIRLKSKVKKEIELAKLEERSPRFIK